MKLKLDTKINVVVDSIARLESFNPYGWLGPPYSNLN